MVQLQVVPVLLQHVLPHRPDVCEAGPVCWAQLPAVLQDGVAVTDISSDGQALLQVLLSTCTQVVWSTSDAEGSKAEHRWRWMWSSCRYFSVLLQHGGE